MKRAGILTFYYNSYNYGGLLQAYALCHLIQKQGWEAEQISFRRDRKGLFLRKVRRIFQVNRRERQMFFRHLFRSAAARISHKQPSLQERSVRERFRQFAEVIPHSAVVDRESIGTLSDRYDLFIVGSDQVWNPEFVPMSFFFDFLPEGKRRASYAASIRIPHFEKREGRRIQHCLERFSVISVRESSSVRILREIGVKQPIEVVLDPTLLMEPEDWAQPTITPQIDRPYMLLYLIRDKALRERIASFAQAKGLRIVDVDIADGGTAKTEDDRFFRLEGVGPGEFLGLIQGAEYVIPDSFHGTALSILFQKKFAVISGDETDDRKRSILTQLGLEDRLVKPDSNFEETLETEPDYAHAMPRLAQLRRDSLQVLNRILSE